MSKTQETSSTIKISTEDTLEAFTKCKKTFDGKSNLLIFIMKKYYGNEDLCSWSGVTYHETASIGMLCSGWLFDEEHANRIKMILGPYSAVYLKMWKLKLEEQSSDKLEDSRNIPEQAIAGE